MLFQDYNESFFYVEGGKRLSNGGFMRNQVFPMDEILDFRKKNDNKDLFLSAYQFATPNVKEGEIYGNFYLDLDSEEDFEKAQRDAIMAIWFMSEKAGFYVPKNMIRISFSGKKGLHIVVPAVAMSVEPSRYLNEYFKVLAESITAHTKHGTIDMSMYDRRRLFRLQNSLHSDTGLYKIPLTHEELVSLSESEIKELAKKQRLVKYEKAYPISVAKDELEKYREMWRMRYQKRFDDHKKKDAKPLDFIPACVDELLKAGPVKGKRNNSAAALVSFYKRQGVSLPDIWDKMVEWNGDSLSERELKAVTESVFHGDYEYGCSTLETLATCIGDDCPLYKKRII